MICDFDGTLAILDIDWPSVRAGVGVVTIAELWERPSWVWGVVAAAEVAAARVAPAGPAVPLLGDVGEFAVLTANSDAAVAAWLARHPALAARCAAVVGREQLGGPKRDPERFAAGFAACRAALGSPPAVRFVSDAAWELDLAGGLGATVIEVAAP